MKAGGLGGGNTLTGLNFEKKVDFHKLMKLIPGYKLKKLRDKAGLGVFFENNLVARCFRKYNFYRFLEEKRVDWKRIISRKLLPDDALLVIIRETLFIIEVKYQQVAGSVDEKVTDMRFQTQTILKIGSTDGH